MEVKLALRWRAHFGGKKSCGKMLLPAPEVYILKNKNSNITKSQKGIP